MEQSQSPEFAVVTLYGRSFKIHPWVDQGTAARILSKIAFPVEDDGCWLWTAAQDRNGYGVVSFEGRSDYAHRVVYQMLKDWAPPGTHHHHRRTCPKICVNPEHITPLSHSEHSKATCTERWEVKATHCPAGHEYSDSNTYNFQGRRFCRACHNARSAEYQERKRAVNSVVRRELGMPTSFHNADKTHCNLGHPYSEENTYVVTKPGRAPSRICKTCFNMRRKAAYYRKTGDIAKAEEIIKQLEGGAVDPPPSPT